MRSPKSSVPLIRRPWFAFLSSMRFAVSLLSILGIASVIGTVLQQNQPMADYQFKFGPFWFQIFKALGLYDVYASGWFVVIMVFLVLSTGLCLWRNIPAFWREMRSFRLKASATSLASMKHSALLSGSLKPEVVARYLQVQGFSSKEQAREDGSILVAAKKGSASKLGYVFAHAAVIVICLGGLIDSNMALNLGTLTGRLVPDRTTLLAKDFKPESRLDAGTLSFRGDVTVVEGQGADVVFLNAGDGVIVQDLPFSVDLKKFHVEYYNTGMPKNFASDIVVTDKATGTKQEATIKVNHPLTVHGITIYQASFGDGGSDLSFKTWDLRQPLTEPVDLKAVSMNSFPLKLGDEQYQIEFGEFRMLNVENMDEAAATAPSGLRHTLNEVRDVKNKAKLQNVGPTISYKVRDQAGQAFEYMNYMLPLTREGGRYFALGERTTVGAPFQWVMMPADRDDQLDSFMLLRRAFADPAVRQRSVQAAIQDVAPDVRASFGVAVDNVLAIFASGGYFALDDYVMKNLPADQQQRMREFFFQVLQGASAHVLDEALAQAKQAPWPNSPEKAKFLSDSLLAMTSLHKLHSPMLMQLNGFNEVRSSGLQMTRSPGQGLVYFGSALLILGTIFMFYIREKRMWFLWHNGQIRVAMSATRHLRDLDREFVQHQTRLEQLAKDLSS